MDGARINQVFGVGSNNQSFGDIRRGAVLPSRHFGDLQVGKKLLARFWQYRIGANLLGIVEFRCVVAASRQREEQRN